ncbi:hypothetical protein GQ55_8G199100 [Panicum hallii var. hallii]|uniref:Phospholipase A2 n=1 Tax=Panicum hallii var. hallii TaxID=1504633 RepID=A0A2T7CPA1_9POAL|nr:hypothetical protein GQ55_8G199100 [Panicum hallii var. hallii]
MILRSRRWTSWNCNFFPTKATKLSSHHGVHKASFTRTCCKQTPRNSLIPSPRINRRKAAQMEFSSSELAGRGSLRQRRSGRRRLLPPRLLLLLLLAVAGHSPAAASIFGGDAASECSRTCESEHCAAAPLMRYGKYCGVSYTGCPGEAPCDALDACCAVHDACVQATDITAQTTT